MKYLDTLALLRGRGNEVLGINLGLHRILIMMQELGNPHLKFPSLHVAGTNGKGSVSAMAESILRHAGWKTGLYTSPHLIKIEERIRVCGQPISHNRFAQLATIIRGKEKKLLARKALDRPLTVYEFSTAIGFLHFAREKVEMAVVEVGLGGLLDATNVIRPRACIITGISYDHQKYLGTTLAQIAGEKAGIIKPQVPVISGCRHSSVQRIIRRKAKSVAAPLMELDKSCQILIAGESRGRCTIELRTPRHRYSRLRLSLAGEHQTRNAALAVMAVETLKETPVSAADIRAGLAATVWPGRLDEYRMPRRTLLDGAHNREGAQMLGSYLRKRKESEVHLVFAALADKDIRNMANALFPLAQSIHVLYLANSRTADPQKVAALCPGLRNRIHLHPNALHALKAAWKQCSPSGLVVVTGSLYLLGEILPLVRKLNKPARIR